MTSYRIPKSVQDQLQHYRSAKNPTLQWILHGFEPKFGERLHELRVNWNQRIRAYYREVLGLSTASNPLKVSFSLDDGGEFLRLIEEEFPDLNFEALVALNKYRFEAEEVAQYFNDSEAETALATSISYAQSEVDKHKLEEVIRRLFDFYRKSPDSDLFGRYSFSNQHLEVFLVPCIIFAMVIQEDFLDVAIGTLAHELAHGFHHVGTDKDNEYWTVFPSAELDLVEGLAEYYTKQFCQSVRTARPGILRAFEKTSEKLPSQYRSYQEWEADVGLETVYQAFIEARRKGIKSQEEFIRCLDKTRGRLLSLHSDVPPVETMS